MDMEILSFIQTKAFVPYVVRDTSWESLNYNELNKRILEEIKDIRIFKHGEKEETEHGNLELLKNKVTCRDSFSYYLACMEGYFEMLINTNGINRLSICRYNRGITKEKLNNIFKFFPQFKSEIAYIMSSDGKFFTFICNGYQAYMAHLFGYLYREPLDFSSLNSLIKSIKRQDSYFAENTCFALWLFNKEDFDFDINEHLESGEFSLGISDLMNRLCKKSKIMEELYKEFTLIYNKI